MKKSYIIIEGKEYPCYVTMGAFLEFRKETGKEATEDLALTAISDMLAWLWAVVKSASRREKVEFPMSLDEFADSITPSELPDILKAIEPDAEEAPDKEDSKKKRHRS